MLKRFSIHNRMDHQKIQLIFILVFGLILIFSFTVYGIQQSIHDNNMTIIQDELVELKKQIDERYFSGIDNIISSLSLNECIHDYILDNKKVNIEYINKTLDTINDIADGSIVYVMNDSGMVIASTIYDDNNSLKGNNYAFRPYFQQAIEGFNTVYPALGVTTYERGIYYSAPVLKNNTDSIIGVVVIKKGLDQLDEILQTRPHPTSVISPEGIIFSTNQNNLFQSLTPLSANITNELNNTQQFAGIPIKPLSITFQESMLTIDGNDYYYLQEPFTLQSWSLFSYQENDLDLMWIISNNSLFLIFSIFLCVLLIICILFYNNILKIRSTKLQLSEANKILEDHKINLEKTVEERTNDLQIRNQELNDINIKLSNTENQLRELNARLEQMVLIRTEEIQNLLNEKIEFINQLGHDLKNPLGPLINLIPLLEKNENDPKKKEMLQTINRNIKHMKNLVVKSIRFSQLQSPNTKLNLETVNLKDEIDDIIQNNTILMNNSQVEIKNNLSDTLDVTVDKLKIQEVFNNLLSNALKYSTDEDVTIIIDQSSIENNLVTISIKDNGIGMSHEQIEKIFNEFYKADGSRHDFDSSGLGMPITKRIIDMHGGNIWVESEGVGKGSTFYFTLPISK